jgi:hypothetical protein
MKFKPIADNETDMELPQAEPGFYTMTLSSYRDEVETKNGMRSVVDFQCGDCRSSFWIQHPDPDNNKPGALWKFKELAKAIGDKAFAQYKEKDSDGFSKFDPGDWLGHAVEVEVGPYGVDKVMRITDTSAVDPPESPQRKQPTKRLADDDIPF